MQGDLLMSFNRTINDSLNIEPWVNNIIQKVYKNQRFKLPKEYIGVAL